MRRAPFLLRQPRQGRQALRRNLAELKAMMAAAYGVRTTPAAAAEMASPPSVTASSGATVPAAVSGGNNVRWSTTPGSLRVLGGWPITLSSVWVRAAAGLATASNARITSTIAEFYCNARYAGLRVLGSTQSYLIEVDGKFIAKAGHSTATTSSHNWFLLDFGSKAVRTIRVHTNSSNAVDGCYVESGSTVGLAPSWTYEKTLHCLMDSWGNATGASHNALGQVPQIGDLLGFRNTMANGNPGTGIIDRTSGGADYNFPLRENDVTDFDLTERNARGAAGALSNVDLLVEGGLINEVGEQTPAAITQAYNAHLSALRSKKKGLPIVVLGPWNNGTVDATWRAVRDAASAACAGRIGVDFVDVEDIVPALDGTSHPTAAGYVTLGAGLAPKIKASVDRMLAAL